MFLLTYGSFGVVYYSWHLTKPKRIVRKCEIILWARLYLSDNQNENEMNNEKIKALEFNQSKSADFLQERQNYKSVLFNWLI